MRSPFLLTCHKVLKGLPINWLVRKDCLSNICFLSEVIFMDFRTMPLLRMTQVLFWMVSGSDMVWPGGSGKGKRNEVRSVRNRLFLKHKAKQNFFI